MASKTCRVEFSTLLHLGVGFICFLVFSGSVLYFIKPEADGAPSKSLCSRELETAKHQLEVVAKYKNNIETMLLNTQKLNEADKDQFKSSMESCFAMTQHSILCQSQLNDLQIKCNKARSDYEKASNELKEIKTDKKLRETTGPPLVLM